MMAIPHVLPSLLDEFAGQINLIYIDPPFATGSDFSFKVEVEDAAFIKEPSIIEQKAYRDTWGRGLDSYLQWFYETAVILRELLSSEGSIYVHCDSRVNSGVRMILDEIFGTDNFHNDIRWIRSLPHNDPNQFGRFSDTILYYSASEKRVFNPQYIPQKEESVDAHYRKDSNGRLFRLASLLAPGGRGPRYVYKSFDKNWRFTLDKMLALEAEGRVYYKEGQMPSRIYYLDESLGSQVQDVWSDISPLNPMAAERVNYPTQKPEALLERIIKTSSNEDDLILDCFCGSGTTAAVAEKLGRRWITCDLGRFAIQTTRKRLLGIQGVKPFVVQNLGKYERQLWQADEFGPQAAQRVAAYTTFILDLYHAQPLSGRTWLHGVKGNRVVHVGSIDSPVTLADVKSIIIEWQRNVGKSEVRTTGIDVLGWDFAFKLNEVARQQALDAGVDLKFYAIPREVLEKKAVEQGDIQFFELAALFVHTQVAGRTLTVELTNFVPPLDYVPQEIRSKITAWESWIDYWAVDFDFKGDTFHNEWQSYRTKANKAIATKTTNTYDSPGTYCVNVKVIDILGNDTTRTLQVEIV